MGGIVETLCGTLLITLTETAPPGAVLVYSIIVAAGRQVKTSEKADFSP